MSTAAERDRGRSPGRQRPYPPLLALLALLPPCCGSGAALHARCFPLRRLCCSSIHHLQYLPPMHAPWTIWRSCFVELWRLAIMSSLVLVSILAFAATVRYIASGRLGPVDALIFISMAMLPMLQFALPFAGGFAATLAYHRMAQDNELVAAGGGGVSHRALLVPSLVSGILLASVLFVLSSEVIPGFYQRMERMVFRDVSRIAHNSLNAGQSLRFRNHMVHADSVRRLGPDRERGIYERLSLTGVAAIELDDDGSILSESTASHAIIAFVQVAAPIQTAPDAPTSPSVTHITLDLRNAFRRQRDGNTLNFASLPVHWTEAQDFRDNPRYLSNSELARIPQNPDRLNHIDNMRRELASRVAEGEALRDIDQALRENGKVELSDVDGRIYVLHAGGAEYNPVDHTCELHPVPGAETIRIERYHPQQGAARTGTEYIARAATIRGDSVKNPLNRRVALSMVLYDARARGPGSEAAGERREVPFNRLIPETDPLSELLRHPSRELIAEVRDRHAAGFVDAPILKSAENLESRINRLDREVVSKLHERWAASAACLVMVVAGAVTAMRLGASLPLTVYLWSFFPALLAVITISMGQQMTQRVAMGALAILWGGVGILAIYSLIAFLMVRRH